VADPAVYREGHHHVSLFGLRGYYSIGSPTATGAVGNTPTTTWGAIRSQMVTTIKALTPATLAATPYMLTETEHPNFRAYAEENDVSVFRVYEIAPLGTTDEIGGMNFQAGLRETPCELVMAYPETAWGNYAGKQTSVRTVVAAMHALIEEDLEQIAQAIGVRGSANYTSGQHAATESGWDIEPGDGVTFGVIQLLTTYYYDAS